jgi:hypothetical protein
MSEKPLGVMPLCIMAVFLGILGILGGGMGIVGLLINPKTAAPDPNPKLAEINAEFERRMVDLTHQTRPASLVVIPAVILTSGLLAAAGIAGIRLQGLGLLKIAFGSNLLVDLAGAGIGFLVQFQSVEILKWYFREVANAQGAEHAVPGMQMGMQFGLYTGMFFGVFWLVAKLVYYILGLLYFNKRAVAEAFAGRPAPDAPLINP